MKTLVYFASGPSREEYQDLDFDKIFLIDNCFKPKFRNTYKELADGKIICIAMDCLESVEFLKNWKVQIDCFVCLNEGLEEGGGSYPINSDMFLGYAMPLFSDEYIHIMNKKYYHHSYNVSMDLPYDTKEIKEDDSRYIDPFIFSKYQYHKGNAKVYQMTKIKNNTVDITLKPSIKLRLIHDSIWNYYDYLETIVISFSSQGQYDFFDKIPKVVNFYQQTLEEILSYCVQNKISKIGFTPFGRGDYRTFIRNLRYRTEDFPKDIILFHLNKNDYKGIDLYVKKNWSRYIDF